MKLTIIASRGLIEENIYLILEEAREGRLLKYGQAFTPETQSVVSFASMAFY
jgi:hypothetical protein